MLIPYYEELSKKIQRGFQRGVSKAIAEHKRNGHSISIWRDGQVVIIPPEEIVVPEYEN